MSKTVPVPVACFATVLALLLSGCGDSHPIAAPASPVAAPPSGSTAAAYVPTTGVFAVAAGDVLSQPSEPSGKCNLDAIDGAPVGSKPLRRGGSALFAGWAGTNDGAAVPAAVTIVLHGAQDFAVQATTGAPRPDVTAANHVPALANSGYAVKANLAAVVAGSYKVELRFKAAGKTWRCESTYAVKVE